MERKYNKKGGNSNLRNARKSKNDEFYTQRADIENEVMHYKEHFKGKTVYLNCDDPRESQFFFYFSHNFKRLGLKKLIASCYKSQDWNLFSQNKASEKAVWLEYTGEKDGGRIPTPEAIGVNYFKGDGDFRSEESIELLKEADIIVTNPPFSLFREYVAQLIEYDKKFLILGNMNAITYKEIFPLIKSNEIWPGVTFNRTIEFEVPDHYDTSKSIKENGKKLIKVPAVSWWTNLEYAKRSQNIVLFRKYYDNVDKYPKYDNYDAINVDKVADIPKDYKGVMGVPITFIGQWNPEQFEVLGIASGNAGQNIGVSSNFTDKKAEEYLKRNPAFRRGFVCYTNNDNELIVPYMRILIRNKRLNPEMYSNKENTTKREKAQTK